MVGPRTQEQEVSILAAELARLKTSEAKVVLVEHLNSKVYHEEGFSDTLVDRLPRIDIVRRHLMDQAEPFYRSLPRWRSLQAAGKGMDALLAILNSGEPGPVSTAAETVMGQLPENDAETYQRSSRR